MRKVELLPARDCEAGYGPGRPLHFVSTACELFWCQRHCYSVVHKGWKTQVNMTSVLSEPTIQADFGLPQRSVLGPLLFTA